MQPSKALVLFLVLGALGAGCRGVVEPTAEPDARTADDAGPVGAKDVGADARPDSALLGFGDGADAPGEAGLAADMGVGRDVGALGDAGQAEDTSPTVDAGDGRDVGALEDIGQPSDAGDFADVGPSPDSGPFTDYLGVPGIGETWEYPATVPTGWPYSSMPCQPGTWNGWANEGWLYCAGHDWSGVGLTPQAAHSGARGLRLSNPGSQRESGDVGRALDMAVPEGSPIWVSMWVRFSLDWTAFNTPTTREPYAHFFFLNSAQSQTGPRVNLLARVPYASPPACEASALTPPRPYMFFSFQTDDHDWADGSYPSGCFNLLDHLGEWLYVQFKLQYVLGSGSPGQGQVEIWIDDSPIYSSTERWVRGEKGFSQLLLSDFSDRAGASFEAVIDIDELRLTDRRPPRPR